MQKSQSPCKISNSKTAQFRFLILAGLVLATVLFFPSTSEAMLPFYAHDWESQLFDAAGTSNFPVVTRIIEEHARLYAEGGNQPGDGAFFENPEKIFYFGTTNIWFAGLPNDLPNAREVLFNERNFYHSTEPSSLVAWWDGSTVEVKWDWDTRFTQREQCPIPLSIDQAQRYRLWRFDSPVDSTLVSDAIEGVNFYSDNPPDPQGDYSYRVETLSTEGNNLGAFLEYTPYGEAVEVSRDSGPHFFHKRLQIQESFYHNFACKTLEDEDPLVFSIQFGVEGDFQIADLELQVCTDFDPDPENSIGPIFLDSGDFEFTIVEDGTAVQVDIDTTLEEIRDTGGFAYRLKYRLDSGDDRFLPPEQDGRVHLFWSSINNRTMGCNWFSYFMKVNGKAWRETSEDALNALNSGTISFNGRPAQAFDLVFMDSALGRLSTTSTATHNRVRPYEYNSQQLYFDDTVSHLEYLSENSQVGMYVNTTNNQLIDAIAPLEHINGFMVENPTLRSSLTAELIQTIWRIHAFPEKRTLILEQGDHFGLPGEKGGMGSRKQVLATYLLSLTNQSVPEYAVSLLGYGGWQVPEHDGKVIIFPEQMLNVGIGDDIATPVNGWPDGVGMDAITDSGGEGWLWENLPGMVATSGGRSYAWRRNELQDPDGNTIGNVWAVLDVEPNLGPPGGTYSLADLIDGAGARTEYYRLDLENEKVLLAEGGSFSTTTVETDELFYSEPEWVSIYFDIPLHTPVVDTDVMVFLEGGNEPQARLKVKADSWDDSQLYLEVDASTITPDSIVVLYDDGPDGVVGDEVAGDGIYTSSMMSFSGVVGTEPYLLPVHARGREGLEYYGDLSATLAFAELFRDSSSGTGNLGDLKNIPWATTTISVDQNLNDPENALFGNEDLFVTIQGSSIQAKLFEFNGFNSSDLSFSFAGNIFLDGEEPFPGSRGIAVADFDNDGYEDLLVCHEGSGKTRLYHWNHSDKKFEDVLESGHATVEGGFGSHNYAAAWGDYNQDGYVDLFLTRAAVIVDEELVQLQNPATAISTSQVYQASPKNGGIHFSPVGTDVMPENLAFSRSLSMNWIDLDGDQDLDILFTGFFGGDGVKILINSGYPDYTYSDATSEWMPEMPYSIWGSTIADLDNDSLPDLVLASINIPDQVTIYKNGGSGVGFTKNTTNEELNLPQNSTIAAGDLDLNGFVDLVLAPYNGEVKTRILLNGLNGSGLEFKNHPGLEEMQIGGRPTLTLHDWDDDGDLDLYLPHAPDEFGTDRNFFFLNGQIDGENSSYLEKIVRVCVVGSHTGSVGTKVSIQAPGGPVRTAYARASEGRGGQTSRILVFGVPEAGGAVSGTVTWPNGDVTTGLEFQVGDELNYVSQSMPIPLASSSTIATRNIGPNGAELEFTCLAAHPLADFQVVLDLSGEPCACGGGQGVLVLNSEYPGVEVDVTQAGIGTYRHKLTLTGWCCINYCTYDYEMSGRYGPVFWSSGQKTLNTSVCGKDVPWVPIQD